MNRDQARPGFAPAEHTDRAASRWWSRNVDAPLPDWRERRRTAARMREVEIETIQKLRAKGWDA